MCDFIDANAGEGTQPVVLLEQYCEMLFLVNNGDLSDKHLRKQLIKIENSVKHELKLRIEMVFLSYRASMSDSLETIYLAAKNNPDYDAYWIPIPYYKRKSDGTFGTMHYEGPGFYGDNFELSDWQYKP